MAMRFGPSFSYSSEGPSFVSFTPEPENVLGRSLFRSWGALSNWITSSKKQLGVKASYMIPFATVPLHHGVPANDLLDTQHVRTPAKEGCHQFLDKEKAESTLSIVVVGATGNLARKKIFPALFALFYEDRLPLNFSVFGYARTVMTDEELRNEIARSLTCRVDRRGKCNEKMAKFLKRCFYHSGQYSSEEHFSELNIKMEEKEAGRISNRLFYLAVAPNMYEDVARCTKHRASSRYGWTRLIVEKPFGHDTQSSREQTKALKQYLTEDQIFRIDHHLGEELVENLLVLRFSNLVFEPLFSRNYVQNVQVVFSQDFGTEGQGRSFDKYGIIRDVMLNHLLQKIALFAMETPVTLSSEDIRNEKVKVLRSMRPIKLEDVVVGQYMGNSNGDSAYSNTDEQAFSRDNLTPTFAAATLFINNTRWEGIPFIMIADKALHSNRVEIRVQFKHVPGNLYNQRFGTDLDKATNELVLREHPDLAIYLKINNKVPGLGMILDQSDLHFLYKSKPPIETPDAYARLLIDAIEGEQRLFIRDDELDAAWAVFTPLFKELAEKKVVPEIYTYDSGGPVGVHYLAAKHNIRLADFSYEN